MFMIGIAGGTGAGKTTVAEEVADRIGEDAAIVPLDNYYRDRSDLSLEERQDINYDHPDAFEWDLLVDDLDALAGGDPVEMPQYDFSVHNRTGETERVEPASVIIVEGILALHHDRVRELLDLQVYVETDADERILRRIQRDVVDRGRDLEGVIRQYRETVKPMHRSFVEPTRRHADVIIPEGMNPRAVDLVVERVRSAI